MIFLEKRIYQKELWYVLANFMMKREKGASFGTLLELAFNFYVLNDFENIHHKKQLVVAFSSLKTSSMAWMNLDYT